MSRIHESRSQTNIPLKDRKWVVAYLRVSSSRQGSEKGFGLKTQKEAIQYYCKQNQLLIHDFYTDVISGTESALEDRDAYWKMLEYCKEASIKRVIVLDVNRLFRDPMSCLLIKKNFKEHQLEVVSLNQPTYSIYGEDDPSEYLTNSLLESLSHYDRLVITSKLKAGRAAKVASGRFAGGGVPLGTQIINRELCIDEDELKIVKLIFKLKKRKLSNYAIARYLNQQNLKGKKNGNWYPTTIKRILENKIYKGFIKHGGKYFKSELGRIV